METKIFLVRANERPELQALLSSTIVIVSDETGKLFKTTVGAIQQVLPVEKNANFAIEIRATQMVEYVCLDNDIPMNIRIGTTPGGFDIASFTDEDKIRDGQPISLMRYTKNDEIIYISGVLPGTITKIKIT